MSIAFVDLGTLQRCLDLLGAVPRLERAVYACHADDKGWRHAAAERGGTCCVHRLGTSWADILKRNN